MTSTDPVRIVEDAIDATLERVTTGVPRVTTERTATAVVEALREAGLLRVQGASVGMVTEFSAITPMDPDPQIGMVGGEQFARERVRIWQDDGHEAHLVTRLVITETTPWSRA